MLDFIKKNWKGALSFIAVVVAMVAIYILAELYQYLAINVWAK